jgi:hypothetical protein
MVGGHSRWLLSQPDPAWFQTNKHPVKTSFVAGLPRGSMGGQNPLRVPAWFALQSGNTTFFGL